MQEPISKLQEEEHQQELLTMKSFTKWLSDNAMSILVDKDKETPLLDKYLIEHGLPLDSVFTD